jgi:hypothetical protein
MVHGFMKMAPDFSAKYFIARYEDGRLAATGWVNPLAAFNGTATEWHMVEDVAGFDDEGFADIGDFEDPVIGRIIIREASAPEQPAE